MEAVREREFGLRICANLTSHPGWGRMDTCPPVATPVRWCLNKYLVQIWFTEEKTLTVVRQRTHRNDRVVDYVHLHQRRQQLPRQIVVCSLSVA